MTNRPPDDPNDPRREHPETRAFEQEEPTEAYRQGDPYGPGTGYEQDPYQQDPYRQEPYPQGSYGPDTRGYDPYAGNAYGGDQYGSGQYGGPPADGSGGSGGSGKRTAALIAAVLAILVAIVVVVALIVRSGGGDDGGSVAQPSTTTSTTTESTTTTTTTTTEESTPTTTTETVPSGSVTYQLTGGGDVVALRYRSGSAYTVVAATGAPWTQATTVGDGTAELTAIVVRGPVTCTILHGEKLLSSSTSNGGPLACSAQVP